MRVPTWQSYGWGTVGAGSRRRGRLRVIGVRARRRLRRWVGWLFVAIGVIGLVDLDLPGAVPLLIGVGLLQGGSGRVRRLLTTFTSQPR